MAGGSTRTLKPPFKAATGQTPVQRVQNLRVEKPQRLLVPIRARAAEVRLQAGYEDASFFRRVLKRRPDLEPAEYRRMFRPFPGAPEMN